jgi:CelD/BcsL family acetyltransferase involved in cellulose biosynthesis
VEIDVVRPSALTAEDLSAWDAMQAAHPALDSPFLSAGWIQAVNRARGDPRAGERVAILRDGGETKGFFAARVAGQTAMPVGAPMNDYQAVVAEPGLAFDPRQLVQALGVQRLDFSHMMTCQTPFAPYMRGDCISYVIDLKSGYGAYEAERRAAGSGVLKDIDKRRRKVEREVGPTTFAALSSSHEVLDQLLDWKRRQLRDTGQTDIFAADWTRRLLAGLFQTEGEGFGGALFSLHIGGQLAAAHLHLRGLRTIHAWIIAHDEAFERYSPGLLLFQDIMRWMDETPYRALDLGAGDYRFKQQLSNLHRPVAHGFVGRPSPAMLMRQAQYGVRAAAERLPLGRVSQLPAKAMRRIDQWRGLR